jgi:hypothetical protein
VLTFEASHSLAPLSIGPAAKAVPLYEIEGVTYFAP